MGMLILPKKVISEVIARHSDAKSSLEAWYREVSEVEWRKPIEVKNRYSTASFLKGNKVIFNIKGKKYRLVAVIDYVSGIVDIRFFGTHSEYDRVNVETL